MTCRMCGGAGSYYMSSMEDSWMQACATCDGTGRDPVAASAEQRGANRMARAMVAALYWRAGEADVDYCERLRTGRIGALGLIGHSQCRDVTRALAEDAHRCL